MNKLVGVLFLCLLAAKVFGQNYDESKVPGYILPDPLMCLSGQPVKSSQAWEGIRRPEILKLFEDNVYGTMPKQFDSLAFQTIRQQADAMDGKAKLKEILVKVYRHGKSIEINLVLFIPHHRSKSSPLFLLINNRSKKNTDPERLLKSDFWPAEMLIDAGYAAAAFHVGDLAPDHKATFATKLLQLYPEELERENGMRAIGAWAFGASRIMDYFETDPDIDAGRVAIVGHSRGGKASLWAAAQDQRFALCFSNCSGNTGAALSKREFGETITYINTTFPHWFTDNYKKYNDREDVLPLDQHFLISLIAPRPVYVTNASEDLWADPKGTYLALKSAEKVFKLYDSSFNLPDTPPSPDKVLVKLPVAYHNRTGKHDMTAFD